MKRLIIPVLLISCGPIYLPVGFISPPSVDLHDAGHVAGGMYFLGGGYNAGDRISGVIVYYRRAISGKFYRLSMGGSAYGGDYYAYSYGRDFSFSGIYVEMEPYLQVGIPSSLVLMAGIYGGLGVEEGRYISSVVNENGDAVPVFRFAYTMGLRAGSMNRFSVRLYLGFPTSVMAGFSAGDRWALYGGIAHSDSGTAFVGASFRFR